ncbi:MAG: hypothetical protein ACR2HJ_04300 [Fimbriimonadales bacterium]
MILGVFALWVAGTARADTVKEHRVAHLAVRSAIQNHMPGRTQVFFTETKSTFLSVTESNVVGEGYFYGSDHWATREFTFRVKVHRSNYETRDTRVTLDNGLTLEDDRGWNNPPGGNEYIGKLTKPSRFTNFSGTTVAFAGLATIPSVDLRIYNRQNKLVRERRLTVKNGKWSSTERLNRGMYRAVLGFARMADSDEVRFSVQMNDADWGQPGGIPGLRRVTITHPKNGATLNTLSADIQGTSNAQRVTLVVSDSRGQASSNQTLRVQNGRWSTRLRLPPGTYKAVARAPGSNSFATVMFTHGSVQPPNERRVTITYPKNGANINSLRADIQGTSTESDVSLLVYNASGRVVSRQSMAVQNGQWSTSIKLENGRYRVKATARSGKDSDDIWFDYGGGASGNGKRVTITWPSDSATVGTMGVDIRGTSTESDVTVHIYNSKGKLVANHSLAVFNGQWNTHLQLPNGRYRITVRSASGKDKDEVTFTRTNANVPRPHGG